MPYSLDELAKDIKGILKDHGIQEGFKGGGKGACWSGQPRVALLPTHLLGRACDRRAPRPRTPAALWAFGAARDAAASACRSFSVASVEAMKRPSCA